MVVSDKVLESVPLCDDNDIYELECRFKALGGAILAIEKRLKQYPVENVNTIDYFQGGDRYTLDEETKIVIKSTKTKLTEESLDNGIYNVKTALSKECNERSDIPLEYNFTRIKNRRRYSVAPQIVVDVTEVNKTKIELEVETVDMDSLDSFKEVCEMVNEMLLSAMAVSYYNGYGLSQDDKKFHSKDFYGTLDRRIAYNPRNFKKEDFVYGGLLPSDCDSSHPTYTITPKLDGLRKNLIICKAGVYLARSSFSEIPIIDKVGKFGSSKCSIVDGELMEGNVFVPFDCIAFENSSNIQNKSHRERLLVAMKLCSQTRCDLTFFYKAFVRITENVEESLDKIEKYSETLKYPTDGYIITPNEWDYKAIKFIESKKYVGKRRTLVNIPDVCKLKPFEKLTIDFYFDLSGNPFVRKDDDVTSMTKFGGTERSPFGKSNYSLENVERGKVNEMYPTIQCVDGEQTIVMLFERVRDDKSANLMESAQGVWRDIHSPIDLDTLRGRDMKFMRLKQNEVKRKVLEVIEKGSYVVDIGSGNGGVLHTFNDQGVDKMISLDVSEKNMKEFHRRWDMMKETSKMKITTLLTGGEDHDTIKNTLENIIDENIEGKKLYITSMLSLSFFFSSEEMLRGLRKTIDECAKVWKEKGGSEATFLFYTIVGDEVLRVMKERGSTFIRLGPLTMKLVEDRDVPEVHIDYPNSIVGDQVEYLVDMPSLDPNVTMDEKEEKVTRYILSEDEEDMYSMYKTGYFKVL